MAVEETDPNGFNSGDLVPEAPILDVFHAVRQANETPLQAAAREMAERNPELEQERREEDEADRTLGDIDDYVKQTEPEVLPEAEEQLAEWQLPDDPLEDVPDYISENEVDLEPGPLVNVFDFSSVLEGSIIKGILNGEGIACIMDNFTTNEYAGILGQSGSYGRILVAEHFAAQAKLAIEAAQASGTEPEAGG
jgi:hypothetical protein